MSDHQVSMGRIVHYTLSENDARLINLRRTTCKSVEERRRSFKWTEGAQAHIGNKVAPKDGFPMVVIRVSGNTVNGSVMLDGNDTHWVTEILEGPGPGRWNWPERF